MRLRQTWIAVSMNKSTIMFSSSPSNIVIPPLSSAPNEVTVDLGPKEMTDSSDFWIALSQEDGIA